MHLICSKTRSVKGSCTSDDYYKQLIAIEQSRITQTGAKFIPIFAKSASANFAVFERTVVVVPT